MDVLYSFVYRGILAEASLDRIGRSRRNHLNATAAAELMRSLSYEMLDATAISDAQRMAIVYAAIHALENMLRRHVASAMAETHGEDWWKNVPERIRERVRTRMEDDAKFKWHGARGATEMNYCDFGDLSSIIVTNWVAFEDVVGNLEWAKQVLGTLERSRNIIMHGGLLSKEDVERIGMNIRDWVRQTG